MKLPLFIVVAVSFALCAGCADVGYNPNQAQQDIIEQKIFQMQMEAATQAAQQAAFLSTIIAQQMMMQQAAMMAVPPP